MEIIWTTSAISSLTSIIAYIEKKFGKKTASRAKSKIQESVTQLISNPKSGKFICRKSSGEEIRFWVINKNKVFYILTESAIIIILVWDTRRDPELLNDLLLREIDSFQ